MGLMWWNVLLARNQQLGEQRQVLGQLNVTAKMLRYADVTSSLELCVFLSQLPCILSTYGGQFGGKCLPTLVFIKRGSGKSVKGTVSLADRIE